MLDALFPARNGIDTIRGFGNALHKRSPGSFPYGAQRHFLRNDKAKNHGLSIDFIAFRSKWCYTLIDRKAGCVWASKENGINYMNSMA
jgi:hypothetical protein